MIQGAKAVYDFTVYVSGEVGKHRHSLYLALADIQGKVTVKYRDKLQPGIIKVIGILKWVLRVLMLIFFARMIFITVRQLTLWACGVDDVWWDDQLITAWNYTSHLADEGRQLRVMIDKFHSFADWLVREQSIDMVGLDF